MREKKKAKLKPHCSPPIAQEIKEHKNRGEGNRRKGLRAGDCSRRADWIRDRRGALANYGYSNMACLHSKTVVR